MSLLESPAKSTNVTRALRPGQAASPTHENEQAQTAAQSYSLLTPTISDKDVSRDDLTGLFLGPYALGAKIGGGGMGKVFKATHVHLSRVFAIKFVAGGSEGNAETQLRFEQETRALGQLQHPQIVNAVDAGCVNGLKYLVTELIDGEDLWNLVQRRGSLSPKQACELIRQAAMGLAYSHGKGFVHRDIKPSNLMLNGSGVVKILDFGLVCHEETDTALTEKGATLGTWDFIAPEQAHDSSEVDERCDIYSLGCTLIYMLSGRPPFTGPRYASSASKLKGHLFDTPSWLERPPGHLPRELIDIIMQMVSKSPAQRFQTAEEVAVALGQYTCGVLRKTQDSTPAKSRSRRRLSRWFVPAAICLLIYWGWDRNPRSAPQTQAVEPPAIDPQITSVQGLAGPSRNFTELDHTGGTITEFRLIEPPFRKNETQRRSVPSQHHWPEVTPNRVTAAPHRIRNALPFHLPPLEAAGN